MGQITMSGIDQGNVDASEVHKLSRALGLKTSQGKKALVHAMKCVQLLDRKQQDYGPNNIAYSGELGIAVRMQDKVCRLRHILESKGEVQFEAKTDTYMDMTNYGIIGIMLENGEWEEK